MTSAARSIGISTLGNAISPLAALASAPLLAQALGAAGRGEVGAATAPLTLLAAGLTLGLPDAATHFAAKQSLIGRVRYIGYVAIAVVGLVSSVGMWLLAPLLAGGDLSLATLITLCGLGAAPILLVAALRGVAAGHGEWRRIALERTVSSIARLALLATLSLTHHLSISAASFTLTFAPLVGVACYARFRPMRATSGPGVREYFLFGARVWPGSLTGILLARLDQAVLLPLSSAEQLGLYAVAVSISEVPLIFNSAVRDVLYSTESGLQDVDRLSRAARLSTAATLSAAALGSAIAWWAVPFLFGPDFSAAIPPLYILLLAIVIGNPGSVAGVGLSARGRPELRSASLGIALSVNVVALALLAPALGATGAALATVAGNGVAGLANVLWMRRVGGTTISDFYGFRRSDLIAILQVFRRQVK